MIQLMKSKAFDGAFIKVIRVIEPKTLVTIVTIYAENPKDGIPGFISCDTSKGIHPDYVDEITRAFQDAWRIAKGYIQIL